MKSIYLAFFCNKREEREREWGGGKGASSMCNL